MKLPPLVVIDTETTGLDPFADYCLQVGAVVVVDGEEVDSVDVRVNVPPEALTAPGWHGARAVNGITDETALFGGDSPEVAVALLESLRASVGPDAVLAGHNVAFDYYVIKRLYQRAGVPFAWSHRKVDLPTLGLVTLGKMRLPDILAALGIKNEKAHDALADARATAQAIVALSAWVSA